MNTQETSSSNPSPSEELDPVYARPPLKWDEGIPYFSVPDSYIENYEHIADDHLAAYAASGKNPFMLESLWLELEDSTERLIRKYQKPGNAVLDVGVGTGRLLSRLEGLRPFGIDVSPRYLQVARAKGIDVSMSRIEDMPFEKDSFDIIIATDVLEHVLDLYSCAAKILDVLRPGGLLFVRVPYREDLSQYIAPGFPYPYVHLRTFDENSIRIMFERVLGMEFVEMNYAGFIYERTRVKYKLPLIQPLWIGLGSLLRRLLPIRIMRHIIPLLCMPVEINAVFRKPI